MSLESKDVAQELKDWFQSVSKLVESSLFSIAPEGPHRDAVVLDVMRRNARLVYNTQLEPDLSLYTPLCFFLAAACRQLKASLGVRHWQAAFDNVRDLRKQLMSVRSESEAIGLDIGTPATLFKSEFAEAIRQAGLVDPATFLTKEDRQIALGLAVNWGTRLLLAYAAEIPPSAQPSERKDLTWLAELMSPAEASHL